MCFEPYGRITRRMSPVVARFVLKGRFRSRRKPCPTLAFSGGGERRHRAALGRRSPPDMTRLDQTRWRTSLRDAAYYANLLWNKWRCILGVNTQRARPTRPRSRPVSPPEEQKERPGPSGPILGEPVMLRKRETDSAQGRGEDSSPCNSPGPVGANWGTSARLRRPSFTCPPKVGTRPRTPHPCRTSPRAALVAPRGGSEA